MSRIAALVGVILAAAILSVGCSRSSGASSTARDSEQNPWKKTALWVEQGDQTRPIENGQAIAVGDVTVEVFVAPYPPLREGSIDLYVRDRTTGRPVEGGSLKIAFDMYMPHGSLRAEAMPTGGGHYLIPYKLVMPGEWRLDVTITHRGDDSALALIFRID